jgi:ion channel POLLUX/CASTOR
MRSEPGLAGRAYAEALHAYELGCPIGLHHADDSIALNPPMDTRIAETDQIILIAEDDLLVRLAARPVPWMEDAIAPPKPRTARADRTLVIGWNGRGPKILDLLDRQSAPDSVVDVATAQEPPDLRQPRSRLLIGYRPCETTSRASLEKLEPGSYSTVVVLADDTVPDAHADDRTLVTLLHLRDIEERLGDPYSIITEMNDDSNREVAQITKADDFIVSSKMISLLMTQMAENRHLHAVFAELFDPAGAEVHLHPADEYVVPGATANFATVIEAARRRGETAIGYRVKAQSNVAPGFGVVLNPTKSTPLTLTAADSVIVIAQEP